MYIYIDVQTIMMITGQFTALCQTFTRVAELGENFLILPYWQSCNNWNKKRQHLIWRIQKSCFPIYLYWHPTTCELACLNYILLYWLFIVVLPQAKIAYMYTSITRIESNNMALIISVVIVKLNSRFMRSKNCLKYKQLEAKDLSNWVSELLVTSRMTNK